MLRIDRASQVLPNRVSTRVDLLGHPASHDHLEQVVEEVYGRIIHDGSEIRQRQTYRTGYRRPGRAVYRYPERRTGTRTRGILGVH